MRISAARGSLWNTTAAILASLVCAGGLLRQLNARPFLPGPDGYYYALQADAWARTGQVKIPDSSMVPRVMGLIQRAGLRTEAAVKMGWVGLVLVAWLAFLPLIFEIHSTVWSWLIFAWVLLSPSLLFNVIEFPRLFLALALVPLWFTLLRTQAPAAALVVAWGALLLHKGITPLVVAFSLGLFATRPRSRRHLLIGVAVAGVLALGALGLSDHLRWADLGRIPMHGGAPGFLLLFHRSSLPISLKIELAGSLLLALILVWRNRSLLKSGSLAWLSIAFLLPALIPVSGSEIFGASERWALLYPFFMMVLTAYELGLKAPGREFPPMEMQFALLASSILAVIFLATPGPLAYAHPPGLDPDNSAYERLVKDLTNQNIPMLIAHRGLNFYYKFRLRRESFPFEPEDFWDRSRVWRLTYRITPAEMNYYLPETCRFGTGRVQMTSVPDYLLIREDCWDAFRNRVRSVDDADLHSRVFESWQNPSQKRPPFLYAKHAGDADSEFPAIP